MTKAIALVCNHFPSLQRHHDQDAKLWTNEEVTGQSLKVVVGCRKSRGVAWWLGEHQAWVRQGRTRVWLEREEICFVGGALDGSAGIRMLWLTPSLLLHAKAIKENEQIRMKSLPRRNVR